MQPKFATKWQKPPPDLPEGRREQPLPGPPKKKKPLPIPPQKGGGLSSAERGVTFLGGLCAVPYAQGSSDAGTRMSARKPNWVTNHCPVLGFLRRLMGRGLSAPPDWMYSVARVST